jgi:hypothetical protein
VLLLSEGDRTDEPLTSPNNRKISVYAYLSDITENSDFATVSDEDEIPYKVLETSEKMRRILKVDFIKVYL